MAKSGFKLEFRSETEAETACAICAASLKQSVWDCHVTVHGNQVIVPAKTEVSDDWIYYEELEAGENLFQRICFDLMSSLEDPAFQGVCYYSDDERTIRITVSALNAVIRFSVRTVTKEQIEVRRIAFDRCPDGTVVKNEFGTTRVKQRREAAGTGL